MIGFFEHQYLSYKKNHIRNLLALARADGHMHEAVEKMLFKIGNRYGLKDRQIKSLMEKTDAFEVNVPDNHNDKMNVLYDLMLIVFADGVIDQTEIAFCEDIVIRFGMKKEVVSWLLHEVFEKGTTPTPEAWEEIKERAATKFV